MKYKVTLFQVGTRQTEVEITAQDEDQAIDLAEAKFMEMSAEEIYYGWGWEFVRGQHEVEEWKEEVKEEVQEEVQEEVKEKVNLLTLLF